MLNHQSFQLCAAAADSAVDGETASSSSAAISRGIARHSVGGATLLDAGVAVTGSLDAGLLMSRVCLGDLADVGFALEDADRFASDVAVTVRSDSPVAACLGGQYAGWPVSVDKYFAMGSGPMRLARGREEMLQALDLSERPERVAGVLESTELPSAEVISAIAEQCQIAPDRLALMIAPAGSLAGTVQVVARSVETSLHKLHTLGFDVRTVFSAYGVAPLPPPARPDDVVGGIGRTNDAILYGGRVTLWVDADQAAVDAVADSVPSTASRDHGRPFASIFKDYGYDFYQVDPHLFSPAVVSIVNRRSGLTRRCGAIQTDVLRTSFGT